MPRPSTAVRAWEAKSTEYLRALRLDSIRNKLLVFAVLATLIPSVTTALLSYIQNRRAITDKITESLRGTSSQAERELDLWLKERLYDLRVFASSFEVTENIERSRPTSLRRVTDYLQAVKARVGDYQELVVLDPRGQYVASSERAPRDVPLPPDWEREARLDNPVVGRVQHDSSGALFLVVGVPIIRPGTGRFIGLLTARLNVRAVNQILASFAVRMSGYLYVIASDGTLITASPDPGITAGDTRVSNDALDQLTEDEGSAVRYTGLAGTEVVGTLHRVRRLHWAVVAETPAAEAYRQVTRLRNVTVATVAALLLGVGVFAAFLATLITRPLNRLSSGAARVAGGDLTVDLPVGRGGGEVGYLTQVFNEMVARLRASREELERLSITDPVTGLFNRRHLLSVLETEAKRAQRAERPFSVLMVDIDHFKDYNDRHGHLAGDDALREVADVIKSCIRTVDAAARYGGEEFAVVLPETDCAGGADVGERIRERMRTAAFDGGAITLSIGVAESPAHGEGPDAILASADAALYEAKRAGRDRVVRAGAAAPPPKPKRRSSRRTQSKS